MAITIGEFSYAQEIEPKEYAEGNSLLCDESRKFLVENSALDNAVVWSDSHNEVTAITNSEFCGNLGCSAIIAFNIGTKCVAKEIHSVQTFIPIIFKESEVQINNVTGCTAWKLVGNTVHRGSC
jgi:hypothetical protein